MQTPVSYVVNAVQARLQSTSIPGIDRGEIHILPEGRCPPTIGERALIISPSSITTVNTETDYRAKRVYFRVNFIRRIRAIPSDKRGRSYNKEEEAHEILTVIEDAIQSRNMFQDLVTAIKKQEDIDSKQVKYSVSKTFTHRTTIYDPIHLYPGFFTSEPSDADASIAGHKFYVTFTSPNFYLVQNPLQCIET